jgi:DNA-binding IclR family transcriptional regulator
LNKTTVAHLLGTLHQLCYVEKTSDGRYRIGPRVLELAQQRLRRGVLTELAESRALALAAELGGVVTVAGLAMGERYKLAKASGAAGPVLDDASERKSNIYDTATGRLLLAFADEAEREQALARHGLPGTHWPEVRDRNGLLRALEGICAAGVAAKASPGGSMESVAVPVRGPDGRVWAALGSAVESGLAKPGDRRRHVSRLRAAAEQMAAALRLRLGVGRPRPSTDA